jgi:hypothetical protein
VWEKISCVRRLPGFIGRLILFLSRLSYGQHRHVIYYYIFVYVRCALPLRAARLLALAAA